MLDADAFNSSLVDDWPPQSYLAYLTRLFRLNKAVSFDAERYLIAEVADFQPKRDVGIERMFRR